MEVGDAALARHRPCHDHHQVVRPHDAVHDVAHRLECELRQGSYEVLDLVDTAVALPVPREFRVARVEVDRGRASLGEELEVVFEEHLPDADRDFVWNLCHLALFGMPDK